jgi:hypothetical protein
MAKIFDFEKIKQERDGAKNPNKETEKPVSSKRIELGKIKDIADMMSLSERMLEIRNATDKVTPFAIQKSREIVKSYSMEELKKWVEDSNEIDWIKKPAFFRAIVEEFKEKIDNIIGNK